MVRLSMALLGVFLIGGCHTSQPIWIQQPNNDASTFCAIGSSVFQQHGGLETQKRVARMNAKAELGRMLEVEITTKLLRIEECHNDTCKNSMSSRSRHYSAQLLGASYVSDEWMDNESNSYYVYICTKK